MFGEDRNSIRVNRDYAVVFCLFAAIAAALVVCIIMLSGLKQPRLFHLTGGTTFYYIDNVRYEMAGEPIMYNDVTYVPAEDILGKCGYGLGWDSERNAVSLSIGKKIYYMYIDSNKMEINGKEREFENPTIMQNDILYMPIDMMAALTNDELYIDGTMRTEYSEPAA